MFRGTKRFDSLHEVPADLVHAQDVRDDTHPVPETPAPLTESAEVTPKKSKAKTRHN